MPREKKPMSEAERLGLAMLAAAAGIPPRARMAAFQEAVATWMVECFGEIIAMDPLERIMRFLEEALELAQASGMSADEVDRVVEYVFARPVGVPGQEVGGVLVTLAAYCYRAEIDMEAEGLKEFARIDTPVMRRKIFDKQAAKRAAGLTSDGGFRPEGDPDDIVMIFSGEHGAFWRAKGEGYVIRVDMAGQWSRSDAIREIAGCGPEKRLTLVPLRAALAPIPEKDR